MIELPWRRGALMATFSEGRVMRSGRDGGRDPPIVRQSVEPAIDDIQAADRQTADSKRGPVSPTLLRLSGVLGREDAVFVRRYRYAGLGSIKLILQSSDEL